MDQRLPPDFVVCLGIIQPPPWLCCGLVWSGPVCLCGSCSHTLACLAQPDAKLSAFTRPRSHIRSGSGDWQGGTRNQRRPSLFISCREVKRGHGELSDLSFSPPAPPVTPALHHWYVRPVYVWRVDSWCLCLHLRTLVSQRLLSLLPSSPPFCLSSAVPLLLWNIRQISDRRGGRSRKRREVSDAALCQAER